MIKKYKYIILIVAFVLIFLSVRCISILRYRARIRQLVCDLSSTNNSIRIESMDKLAQMGDASILFLLKVLTEENWDSRVKIDIIQLLSLRHSSDIALKLSFFLKDEYWKIRFFTAQSLGEIGSSNIVEQLMEAWKVEKNWQVSQEIMVALYKIKDEEKTIPVFLNSFNTNVDLYRKGLSSIILYEFTGDEIYSNFIYDLITNKKENEVKNKILFTLHLNFSKSPKIVSLIKSAFDSFDEKTKSLLKKGISEFKE